MQTPTSQPEIPTFAVVGEPNEGKTTIVATLAEVDWAKIGPEAGTTERRMEYVARVGELPVLRFIDTPGFGNTAYLREWFERHKDEPGVGTGKGTLAQRFIREHEGDPQFTPECEILRAVEGVAVIYVVDGSRALRQEDRDQVEILRLCSSNRIALINRTSTEMPCLQEWQDLLGRAFAWREFDAHHVTFQDRIELLEAISFVMPAWKDAVRRSITLFQDAWAGRLADVRDYLLEFLEESMTMSVSVPVAGPDEVRAATEKAAEQLRGRLREREQALRAHIRRLFNHTRADWVLPERSLLAEDLFSEQVWKLFGLDKQQLIWAGATMGAVLGGGIDLMLGGATLLLGAVLGAAAGAATGWLTAGKSVEIKSPPMYVGGIRLPGAVFAKNQTHVEARAHPQSNLLWILIDRALGYVEAAATWSHGRRQEEAAHIPVDDERLGRATRWSNEQKAPLIQWLGMLRGGKAASQKAQEARRYAKAFLLEQIQEITRKQ